MRVISDGLERQTAKKEWDRMIAPRRPGNRIRTALKPRRSPAAGDAPPADIAYYLMTIANLIAKNTAQNTLSGVGVSLNGWRILRFLAVSRSGSAAGAIAALGIDKTTVSRAITELHAGGLIRLSPNPEDRRQTLISLRAAGKRIHDRIYPVDRAFDASFEAKLTRHETAVLRPILAKLRAHAQALLEA
ncbi:MAG: MarR family winged helix-turn-helix transcriptional regulator [Gemmatimonadota bacterium]